MKNNEALIRIRNRRIEGAKRFAAAEKSDPFAFARAVTHINCGIVSNTQEGKSAEYDAEAFQEERALPDGTTYHATVYKNVSRP